MVSDFIEYIIKKNLVKRKEIDKLSKAVEKEFKPLEEIILERNIIPEEVFFQAKSEFYRTPLRREIVDKISPSILEGISEEAAYNNKMIPLRKEGNILEVGMVNPENLSARSALDFISRQKNFQVVVYLILPSEFKEAFKKYRVLKKEVKEAIEKLEMEEGIIAKGTEEIEAATEEAPVSKIVSVILKHAVEGKASDIHIEPYSNQLRVRFRMDGVLYSSLFLDKKFLSPLVSRIKILSSLRIDETRIPQDGRFYAVISGKKINFRIGTFPTPEGEKVAIRVLDPSSSIVGFSHLGIIGRNFELIQQVMRLPFGLILFCGPTGSGKTTTQYTLLQELNKEDVNIVTLEDPVEYWIKGINQSQVRPEIGYTFASGLRQILRQDPDIIMVGEIRDGETASLAIHSALTGHLVLSTLHTNNAIGVIPRLVDMGVEPFLLPVSLKAAVSQRLVKRLCPYCKEKVRANDFEKRIIKEEIGKLLEKEREKIKVPSPIYVYKPKGCPKCAKKGTKGRVGVYEVLVMTKELEKIILTDSSEYKIAEEARNQGMVTMKQDGILKILEGIVSPEEVFKVVEAEEEAV